jgi:predicted transcriptional regulator
MDAPKNAALRMIERLPDDSSYEDIQYHLMVMAKIKRGQEAAERGEVIPHEEAKRQMKEWLASFGAKEQLPTDEL